MEEKKEKFSVNTENLKNETVEAAKKVKESIKGANIKEETKQTKGFVIEMFKNPLGKIKQVASDTSGKFFKTAIFFIIIWTILVLINSTYETVRFWGIIRVFNNMANVLKAILAPICGIIVYSVIVVLLNKKNKKPLTTVISTITITQIPLILSELIFLLNMIDKNVSLITKPFEALCATITIVLGYFGLKNLFEEEKSNEFIKKYVKIQAIYFVAYIVIGLFGIYI